METKRESGMCMTTCCTVNEKQRSEKLMVETKLRWISKPESKIELTQTEKVAKDN